MGTRDAILDAALEVVQTRGLARATTREISRAAGYSEATLYKHFRDKGEIFVCMLRERSPHFTPLLLALQAPAGSATVERNLTAIATAAVSFYRFNFPMFASIFGEPEILGAHREALEKQNAGPHHTNQALAGYLRAEQRLGRVAATADPDATADLLLGACFQHAFLTLFAGRPSPGAASAETVAAGYVLALLGSLAPPS